MPELPEVETLRRGIHATIEGHVISEIRAYREDLRFPIPKSLTKVLTGRRLVAVGRRAKYLLWQFEHGWTMLMHLGMSGSVRINPDSVRGKHDHLCIKTKEGVLLRYNDPRRFGYVALEPEVDLSESRFFKLLGPEPLEQEFSPCYAYTRAKNKNRSIKALIMDQNFVVGVGNIYASEALFSAGIHPRQPAKSLDEKEWHKLVKAIKVVLNAAIQAGGSSLKDYKKSDGSLGYFQHQWSVYGRKSQPCLYCGEAIMRIVMIGRATYFCPSCQSESKNMVKVQNIR